MNEYIDFLQQLGSTAGKLLKQAYNSTSAENVARRESPKGMKLAEDNTMDQWIIQHIQQRYPDHSILTEESGMIPGKNNEYLWIVDPIDGSVNFSTHNPFVAISIALMIRGELVLGMIEAPMLGEQFLAVKGGGATVNGQPLHVSATTELSKAYLVSCDGGMEDRTEVFSTLVRNYYDQVIDFRKLGSAALECAWVAAGRADGYITMAIDPWDVAAGALLITEAGGTVTTFKQESWTPTQTDLICSNGLVHKAIVDRIWGE